MPYLNCPRCMLSIRIQHANLAIDRCPRCLARSGRVAYLQLADRPAGRRRTRPRPAPHEQETKHGH
jgi:Zn-finger nucleic acid-binding protein